MAGFEDWTGKHVVVTGAAGGIGGAIAEAAASRGATVVAVDRAEKYPAPATRGVGEGEIHERVCDVSVPEQVVSLIDGIVDEFGVIDAAFNNAGVAGGDRAFLDIGLEDWDGLMNVNLRGAFVVAQAVARHMVARGQGAIVNTTSQLSHVAAPEGNAHYVSSKGGLLQLTRAMAVELAPLGVQVNALAPGVVATGLNRHKRDRPEYVAARTGWIPLGRFAEPAEIADVALFLASPAARYMAGSSVVVDGGYLAW